MSDQLVVGIKEVQAVLVRAHPCTLLAVDHDADHTGRTDGIARTQFIAHILEAVENDRLLIKTFLQQSQPNVAAIILDNRIDLTTGQVDLHTEEGIVLDLVLPRVVNGNTFSVVADEDTVITVAMQGGDAGVARRGDMHELISLLTVQALIGSYIYIPLVVFADADHRQVAPVCQILPHLTAVVTEQSRGRQHPQSTLLVLYQGVHGMDVSKGATQLASRIPVGELHHTET